MKARFFKLKLFVNIMFYLFKTNLIFSDRWHRDGLGNLAWADRVVEFNYKIWVW